MKRNEISWLREELPKLVEQDIITVETAERIQSHYSSQSLFRDSRNVFPTAFGILGAVLVGLGIILILAHNWDNITRFNRLLLITGMLAATQLFAGVIIWRRNAGLTWREGSATLNMLVVGAAIALVGQTYHLVDDRGTYILTWMLLSLPLVYLFDALIPAVLYLVVITVWIAFGQASELGKQLVWLLYGLVAPYGWGLLKDNRTGNRAIIWTWVAIISCCFSFAIAFDRYLGHTWGIVYSGLFTAAYFAGDIWFDGSRGWRNPFRFIGMMGLAGITFLLTFKGFWYGFKYTAAAVKPGELLLVLAVAVFIGGLGYMKRKRGTKCFDLFEGVFGIIIIGNILQWCFAAETAPVILLNAYMLALGLAVIVRGVKDNRLGILNVGMLMVAGLVFARFMDIQFSFVARGVVFVLLGLGFLAANLIMARRRTEVPDDKP